MIEQEASMGTLENVMVTSYLPFSHFILLSRYSPIYTFMFGSPLLGLITNLCFQVITYDVAGGLPCYFP